MKKLIKEKEDTPAVKLLKQLLYTGYQKGASDIHIEPQESDVVIRMRVDGLLTEVLRMEKELHSEYPFLSETMHAVPHACFRRFRRA